MAFNYLHKVRNILFITMTVVLCINCYPVNFSWEQNGAQTSATVNPSQILNFLRKFGYLNASSTTTTDTLYHEEAIIAGIKNMQKYGALNQTGILDSATVKLLTAPRCGVPDIPKHTLDTSRIRVRRFALGSRGWAKRRITYYIANWSPKVGEEQMVAGMEKAFQLWSKYSKLQFVRSFEPNADIILSFGSSYHGDIFPFDGPGNVLAHAFFPYEMSSFGGDIHFDNDENWKENASVLAEGVDFTSVAIHELGHSLGLAHSPIFDSIMFPYYKGPQESKDLGYDDIMAMYELYIRNGVFTDEDESTQKDEDEDKFERDAQTETTPQTTTEAKTTPTTKATTTTKIATEATTTATSRVKLTTEAISTMGSKAIESTTVPMQETTLINGCKQRNQHRFSFSIECNSTSISPEASSLCENPRFDAVALLRGEIFVFKNEYVWRLSEDFQIQPGYPIRFNEIFQDIPSYVRRIDAAYERKSDGAIILFHGRKYWVYDGYTLIENSPRSITDYGFDASVEKVDAAMVWSKNGRTYLFSGMKFVRYDDERRQIDAGYPSWLAEKWHGIPNNIDAVISMINGKTYFFKGDLYWMYNNYWIRPKRGYPRRTSINLLGCSH